MPGGFENSAMKTSFSLSSLQPSSVSLEGSDQARPQDRPYNSLRKKCRKDPEQEAWRRSWGTREEGKEEFWAALQYNYNYLMDSNLIDSCKEARRDLQYGGSPSHDWNYQQFCEQFLEILTWLQSIQENIYSKQENVIDRNLRLSYLEEMNRKSFKRKLFNNQGGRLVVRSPDLKDEVAWRVLTLNSKWETLEQTVTPRKRTHPDHLDVCIDVEHELRCLRKWIKQTALRLQPLDFHMTWTLAELEEKAKEHEVLQRDVESHGKIVCSVLKLCEKVAWADAQTGGPAPSSFSRSRRTDSCQAVHCARGLERRWQLLYLRSLEWLCHIEGLINKLRNQSPLTVSSFDSDEEPVVKQPRLSEEGWPDKSAVENVVDSESLMEVSVSSTSDMVGAQSEIEVSRTQSHLPIPYKNPLATSLPDSTSLLNRPVSMQLPSKDNTINDNYPYHNDQVVLLRRQSVPPDAVRKLFVDETSTFTSSDRSAPNCAIFYFRHLDTDSEQDRVMPLAERKSMDDSSEEDDWTYSCCELGEGAEGESPAGNGDTSESASSAIRSIKHAPTRSSKETIQHLVNQAEQMVASPSHKIAARVFEPLRFNEPGSKSKFYRVKEWMKHINDADDGKIQGVGDSCDASGEYTTEEEERHSSGDFNTTVVNCHQSAEALPGNEVDGSAVVPERTSSSNLTFKTPEHLKVVMRPKKREGNAIRPWSVSGITQLVSACSPQLSQFSISESALHQLAQTPTNSVKMDTSVQGTLSSSTTVEETPSQAQEGSGGGYSSNSLRRRKVKLRKRNLGRKSESGSDGLSPHDPPSPLKTAPTRRPQNSGTETEDDEGESEGKARAVRRRILSLPAFRLGPDGGSVTVFTGDKILSGDSSFSEQAWDNYQEKYMSEAYSEETADNEAARRLLEFGDDYRNFLDSQSDCASSLSFGRGPGFHRRRRPAGATRESSVLDSDSDLEDLRSLVHQSHSTLVFSEQVYARHIAKGFPQLVRASDIEDILTTSKEHIHCLRVLVEGIEDTANLLSAQECRDIKMLVEKWETLQGKAEDLQRMQTLQAEISTLKDEFVNLSNRVTSVQYDNMTDREQLELRIQQVKSEMSFLRDRKSQLLQVNMAVNKFLTDTKHPAEALKEGVADLYHVWNETSQRVGQQLSSLQQLSAAWQQFDLNLSELQVALRGDHETLKQLDSAVQEGSITPDVATSVRDVAKVLSEKPEFTNTVVLNDTTTMILSTPICTEGSLSDSGISDSGSEQDLNERERRLAALRRLARRLESILSPGSQVIADIAKRIEQTEKELRGLQQTCRDLVLRTAVCAEATAQGRTVPNVNATVATQPTSQRSHSSTRRKKANGNRKTDPDDPEPDKPTSWLWRVMRTAFPFQMAIVALFCAACLLEPHCCDSMNNLNFSLTPQLRYIRGPPPV